MSSPLVQTIAGQSHDLGGFTVRRMLPQATRRSVGPFIFFDHIGPAAFAPGIGIDVRPHPHIGLATVTYLLEGDMLHRDSLGTAQTIRPGDVNWMIAGRGIVHSERSGPERRASGGPFHGIQTWIALPREDEETAPDFAHHGKDELPLLERDGFRMRLIAGAAFGERAPVRTFSDMFYLHAEATEGGRLVLPAELGERAVHVVHGGCRIGDEVVGPATMAVLSDGAPIEIEAEPGSCLMLAGGAPLEGPRHMWWNFVSSSKERIERAKADWKAGRFAKVPGDEVEFIPLPD